MQLFFFFFLPPLAQCRKLFLLPHDIILQHLWLMHLRFRLPLHRSGDKVNFGWLPDVIITYLRFWQNTDATPRGSGEMSKGIMSVSVIAQRLWFIRSGPEFEQTVNTLRLFFFFLFFPLHRGTLAALSVLFRTNCWNNHPEKSRLMDSTLIDMSLCSTARVRQALLYFHPFRSTRTSGW